jgi:hypothetical protein
MSTSAREGREATEAARAMDKSRKILIIGAMLTQAFSGGTA